MADADKGAGEYDRMLLLEDLESLAEEMDEVGVTSLAEVRRWLAQPRTDAQAGVPSTADTAALAAIAGLMTDLDISDRAQLGARIRALQEVTNWA